MYRLSTSVLLLLLIWVATVKAQSIEVSEEEIFECSMYIGCKHPLETGKMSRFKEVYDMGGPKMQNMGRDIFGELSGTPMPKNTDEIWNKTVREICAKKTEAEMKNIITEFLQELAMLSSNFCENKDTIDKVECEGFGKGSAHFLAVLTEAKAKGKCGKTLPASLPKFG